jgi:hypothetical protein
MKRHVLFVLSLVSGLLCTNVSHATLIDRGGGLIYDDVLDITWLQNANLAATNTFGLPTGTALGLHPSDTSGIQGAILTNGAMNWPGALFWIDAMNAAMYLGFDDWRLASLSVAGGLPIGSAASVVDCSTATEIACRDNELAYMYYWNLTPVGDTPPTDLGTDLTGNQALIENIQAAYRPSTEFAPDPDDLAWVFGFVSGDQLSIDKELTPSAWAVRPGDVLAVPEPATWLLFGAGLAGLAFARRSRNA